MVTKGHTLLAVKGWLPDAGCMHCPVADGFIDEDVTIANLNVEPTLRVGADPGLVVDGGPLAAEVG